MYNVSKTVLNNRVLLHRISSSVSFFFVVKIIYETNGSICFRVALITNTRV